MLGQVQVFGRLMLRSETACSTFDRILLTRVDWQTLSLSTCHRYRLESYSVEFVGVFRPVHIP